MTPPTQAMLAASAAGPDADANLEATAFPSSQALLDYTTHRLLWSWYSRDRDSGKRTEM
jgi:hypothetical protein